MNRQKYYQRKPTGFQASRRDYNIRLKNALANKQREQQQPLAKRLRILDAHEEEDVPVGEVSEDRTDERIPPSPPAHPVKLIPMREIAEFTLLLQYARHSLDDASFETQVSLINLITGYAFPSTMETFRRNSSFLIFPETQVVSLELRNHITS